MLLPDQTLGKPLTELQELGQRDQNITEGELEASHAVNGTSGIRAKRDLPDCKTNPSDCLKNYCLPVPALSSPGNGCEIGRYMCRGYYEAVCKPFSWQACNANVYLHGYPKCFPQFEKVSINTSQGTKFVWRTEHCSC